MSAAEIELDSLLIAAKAEAQPTPAKTQAIAKLSYTHDAMIDLLIANPAISQGELAEAFGYTQSWVCQIMASDVFQARFAERSKELVDPTIIQSVQQRFQALVLRSLEILAKKLEKPADQIPDNLALRTFELASRAAGYGGKVEAPAPAGDIHLHLEGLGGNLVSLLRQKRKEVEAIDAEILPDG